MCMKMYKNDLVKAMLKTYKIRHRMKPKNNQNFQHTSRSPPWIWFVAVDFRLKKKIVAPLWILNASELNHDKYTSLHASRWLLGMYSLCCNNVLVWRSKIEKVPRGIRGEKSSKDMASSRNLVSTIGALASPKIVCQRGPLCHPLLPTLNPTLADLTENERLVIDHEYVTRTEFDPSNGI